MTFDLHDHAVDDDAALWGAAESMIDMALNSPDMGDMEGR